jgi:putative transposase
LTLLDIFTREALGIEVDKGITGEQVARALQGVIAGRGAPKRVRVDNGPEFVSNALDRWAYENKVTLDFRSTMTFVESFNGCLREGC